MLLGVPADFGEGLRVVGEPTFGGFACCFGDGLGGLVLLLGRAGVCMEFLDGVEGVGLAFWEVFVPPVPASSSSAGVEADISVELFADTARLSPGEKATLLSVAVLADLVPVMVARLAVPASLFDMAEGAETELAGDADVRPSTLPPPETRATASCWALATSSALFESLRVDGPCEL
mmetsp:Transcript_16970/g.39573  ORF Transcript_16970/g.39573 Transcript_16970/m.39573 type:complete len:177 (+) Transcript_16970:235-765(+)